MTLHGHANEYLSEPIDVDMLDRLNELYIDARCPGERGLLPGGKPSKEETLQFSRFAEDVLRMLNQRVRRSSE